jgi:hypothetical protein
LRAGGWGSTTADELEILAELPLAPGASAAFTLADSAGSRLARAVDGSGAGAATQLEEPRRHAITSAKPATKANAMASAGQ